MEMEFVEPPRTANRWGEVQKWLEELKKHPGRWAVRHYDGESGYRMRSVLAKKYLDYEFTSRGVEGGTGVDLFARYIGD